MRKIKTFSELRNIEKMNDINDGSRSLFESVVSNEVLDALTDWVSSGSDGVLIGGLALSYYVKPRSTMDVDVLFLSPEQIPDSVPDFKRHRKGAFQHNKTHVEIEVLTPKTINITTELVQSVIDTSIVKDGIRIASPSALIALKLGRFSRQDQADIEALTNSCEIDLTPFNLSPELIEKYSQFKV